MSFAGLGTRVPPVGIVRVEKGLFCVENPVKRLTNPTIRLDMGGAAQN